MAQEKRNRLVELLDLVRTQGPTVRRHLDTWVAEVREEPRVIWETPTVRYFVYGFGAIVLFLAASTTAKMLVPPPPASAKPQATTADYHVVCADSNCGTHFVIHRKFGFSKFPVECVRCRNQTGARALRCNSTFCRGRWVAPLSSKGELTCPSCGGRIR